jgi:hypothetical protein
MMVLTPVRGMGATVIDPTTGLPVTVLQTPSNAADFLDASPATLQAIQDSGGGIVGTTAAQTLANILGVQSSGAIPCGTGINPTPCPSAFSLASLSPLVIVGGLVVAVLVLGGKRR